MPPPARNGGTAAALRGADVGTSEPESGKRWSCCNAAKEATMRRFLLSAAALVVGLALVGSAEAGPKSGPGSSSHGHNDYHLTHGTKFKDGYFFRGHDHSHWSYRYWWPKYGCYTYYCPSSCCWYYWYAPHCC